MIQIDVIGVIYAPPVDDQTPPVAMPGWHVNTSHEVPGWDAQQVMPITPRQIFGGIPTTFYTWPSKADFDAALAVADLSDPVPPPVIPDCTPRQIRQALTHASLRSAVESAISASDQDTKDWWAFATKFERNHPRVISMGVELSKTKSELDALFIFGASL